MNFETRIKKIEKQLTPAEQKINKYIKNVSAFFGENDYKEFFSKI